MVTTGQVIRAASIYQPGSDCNGENPRFTFIAERPQKRLNLALSVTY